MLRIGSYLMFSTALVSLTLFWFCFLCVYFGQIFFTQEMVLINLYGAIQLLRSHLGGGGPLKCEHMQTGREAVISV